MTTLYEDELWRKHREEMFEIERRKMEQERAEWDQITHVKLTLEVGYRQTQEFFVKKSDISRIQHYLMNLSKQHPA